MKRNLSMAWVDVKKAHNSVDFGWLKEMMVLHRFPNWLREAIGKLCRNWNTRVVVTTRQGREISEPITCPSLFTVCLNRIAWKINDAEGYKLSKPINAKVTDLL